MTRPTLGPLLWSTVQTSDPTRASELYEQAFGYVEICRGRVSPDQAEAWGVAKLSGLAWRYLAPAGGQHGLIGGLRLLEGGVANNPASPLTTFGWAAAELSVQDVDGLAERLAASDFRIIGPPRSLGSNPHIKAMQVAGPWGEVFYLTDVRAYAGELNLVKAACAVDRTFIAVLASPDFLAARNFYTDRFNVAPVSDHEVVIPVLNEVFGLAGNTAHRIGSLQLQDACLIEIDQYPDRATPRPQSPNSLPPGIAMISFAQGWPPSARPDRGILEQLLARPGEVLTGAAGELCEFVGPPPNVGPMDP